MNVCSRRVDLSSINISVFLSLNRTNCYDDKRNWSYHYLPSTGKKEYKNSGYSATNRENRLVFPMLFSRHCRQNISSWLFLRNLPTDFPRFNLIYSKTQLIFFILFPSISISHADSLNVLAVNSSLLYNNKLTSRNKCSISTFPPITFFWQAEHFLLQV